MSSASASLSGTSRSTTSATASARTPPTPSMTVGPNWGSSDRPAISSRVPDTMGATSTPTSPSAGVAAASRAVAASSTAPASRRLRRTRPRSVLCAMRSPHSFATTGYPSSVAAAAASAAVATIRSPSTGMPCSASSALEAASDRVWVDGAGAGVSGTGGEPTQGPRSSRFGPGCLL